MSVSLVFLVLTTLSGLGAGFVILRALSRRSGIADEEDPGWAPEGRLTVVIPARNEERNLPQCLASIRSQSVQPYEVIVVDDGSTDGTAALATAAGARVIAPGSPPTGWTGKTWACQRGALEARGELLLFLDADVRFAEAGALSRLLRTHFRGEPLSATSILPFHEVRAPYESLSAVFNLVMAWVGIFDRRLFGQSLLIDRGLFLEGGGYSPVSGQVLENFFLTDTFKRRGIEVRPFLGRGILAMRMYPDGPGSLVQGWGKAFARGAGGSSRLAVVWAVLWMSGGLSAWIATVSSGGGFVWGPVLVAAQAALLFRTIGSFGWPAVFTFPLLLGFFQLSHLGFATRKFLGRSETWRGREILRVQQGHGE